MLSCFVNPSTLVQDASWTACYSLAYQQGSHTKRLLGGTRIAVCSYLAFKRDCSQLVKPDAIEACLAAQSLLPENHANSRAISVQCCTKNGCNSPDRNIILTSSSTNGLDQSAVASSGDDAARDCPTSDSSLDRTDTTAPLATSYAYHTLPDVLGRPEALDSESCVPWCIDTKYYTAQVVLWLYTLSLTWDQDMQDPISSLQEWTEMATCVDAVLFVWNRQEPGAWDAFKRWKAFVTEMKPSIWMCIVQGQGSLDALNLLDYCIEHEIELLDMQEEPMEDGDTVGVERIRECLASHIWEGMIRKQDDSINVLSQQEDDEQEYMSSRGIEPVTQSVPVIQEESSSSPSHKIESTSTPNTSNRLELWNGMDDAIDSWLLSSEHEDIMQLKRHLFGSDDTHSKVESNSAESDITDPLELDITAMRLKSLQLEASGMPMHERRKLAAHVALAALSYLD